VSVTVTVDGRTTLNESDCSSAMPSPFGEMTASAGGGAYTPKYWSMRAVEIARSLPSEGEFRTVPSKASDYDQPPRRTSVWASSKFVIPTE
jgi:hypothetical protein